MIVYLGDIFEAIRASKNFYNAEFNILKGTIKSLCEDVVIKVNDSLENNK